MKGFIVTIVAIVFLSVVVESIIPNSSLNKYIRAVFGLVVLTISLNAFIGLKDGINLSFDSLKSNEIIYSINKLKLDAAYDNILKHLELNGVYGANVSIECELYDYDFKLDSVSIDFTNLSLEDIDLDCVQNNMLSMIMSKYNVNQNCVVFYG